MAWMEGCCARCLTDAVMSSVRDVKGDKLQENTRLGLTVALPVNRYNSIKLYASTGVFAHTGSNFNTGGIVWQFRWGGGL
jgi:hypothetical protein